MKVKNKPENSTSTHERQARNPEAPLPIPPGFDALSKAEQVRYLQALWDQISEDPDALPVPESHLSLVEERLKRYREEPSRGHSAFEVLDRLAEKSSDK